MAFYFERPKGFKFIAGQYADFTLIKPPETDDEGNIRSFSIASAPQKKELMIAMRMRDTAFKRVLKTMPLKTKVKVDGPMGSLILHQDAIKPAVFLIGGIGITPVRSIILDAIKRKLPHELILFYSNRDPKDAAFFAELKAVARKHKKFIFIPAFTELKKSNRSWSSERGYIGAKMIEKYIADIQRPIYYLAGPPKMVAAMQQLLKKMKVSPDNIRLEEFAGY